MIQIRKNHTFVKFYSLPTLTFHTPSKHYHSAFNLGVYQPTNYGGQLIGITITHHWHWTSN